MNKELKSVLVTMTISLGVILGYLLSFIYFDRWAELNSVRNVLWMLASWFSATTVLSYDVLCRINGKEGLVKKEEEP